MLKHISRLRVRYADTDQMKGVYYGKYFEYFEQARTDLLRAIGLSYAELERLGFQLPVVEAQARYRRAARYDDLLLVEARLAERPVARVRIEYTVFREGEEEALADGFTVHAFVRADSGKPTRAPALFLHAVEDALKAS